MTLEITSHKLIVETDNIKTQAIEAILSKCNETAKKTGDLTEGKLQRLADLFCSRAFSLFSDSLKKAFPEAEYKYRIDILISAKRVDFFSSSLKDRMIQALTPI